MAHSLSIGLISTHLKILLKTKTFVVIIVLFMVLIPGLSAESQKEYIYLDGKVVVAVVADCTYTISLTSASPAAGGASGNVAVTSSNASCQWTTTNNASSFVTITGSSSGTGNGTVNYTVAANTGPARSGTITIAGKTFTINQANGCTYSISPTSVNIAPNSANGSVTVNRSSVSCVTTATSNASWITATVNSSGNVNYTASSNYGAVRNGTVTIGGKTFTVTQKSGSACSTQQQECYSDVPTQCQSYCEYITEDPNCNYNFSACYNAVIACTLGCQSQAYASCDNNYNYCLAY